VRREIEDGRDVILYLSLMCDQHSESRYKSEARARTHIHLVRSMKATRAKSILKLGESFIKQALLDR
jgi:hypothetical protein